MKKLEVGMEVCTIIHRRFTNDYRYEFSKVVKLTPKRATLANGDILNNELVRDNYSKNFVFKTYGNDNRDNYIFVTPEILADDAAIKERQKISLWFNAKKFTSEEQAIIYKQFEQLGKL
jgi:hypothetical protein